MFRPSETRDVSLSERRCERERKSERIDQKPGFLPGPADVWFHAVFQSLWKSHHPPLPLLWDLEEARILGLEGQSSLHFVEHQTVVGLMKDVKLNEVLVEYPPGWTSSSQFCHWLVGLAHALTIGVWQKHWVSWELTRTGECLLLKTVNYIHRKQNTSL